ncbi:hypothetical protein BB560_001171 [Smittium megazygosporum]|uniref:CS domain-containing protein n=1 Tax=Smittium megazygosporum TaxID=133381 RepID=A0A2T9ZI87_9FUNG|nr:hypothetical protein BB560_001171 [Smittium megazygosporum]
MITPKFEVTQDESFVFVVIHIFHFRANNVELDVNGNEFRFFASPYYLRLRFPGEVVEDTESKSELDISAGKIYIKLSKAVKGEHFPDIDLPSVLLASKINNKGNGKNKPLIEEIETETNNPDKDVEEEDLDWEITQTIEQDPILSVKYGFNNQYNGWFVHVNQTPNEVNDIAEPETTNNRARCEAQYSMETESFNEDYYMSNYIDDDEILLLLEYEPWFQKLSKTKKNDLLQGSVKSIDSEPVTKDPADTLTSQPEDAFFTQEEKLLMMNLKKKTCESNVESAWMIGKLSSSCSCLRELDSLKDTLVSSIRRSLVYPLFRNWDLAMKIKKDVELLFSLGKRYLLKALLEIKQIFDHHDIYYVYSKILLDDYCVWIQTSAKDSVLKSLSSKIKSLNIIKYDVDEDLIESNISRLNLEDHSASRNSSLNEDAHQNKENPLPNLFPSTKGKKPLIEVIEEKDFLE